MIYQKPELKRSYVLSRHFQDSVRLSMQHWMWNCIVGYHLNPNLKQLLSTNLDRGTETAVADIGCGNAAWLLELHRDIPDSQKHLVKFQGLDISSAYFPDIQNLPEEIKLDTADVIQEEVPSELVGKFDIVHIRLFAAVIRGNDPHPILQNARALLKPNGYFQWDELDLGTLESHSIGCQKGTTYAKQWIDAMLSCHRNGMNIDFGWISKLDYHFRFESFADTQKSRYQCRPEFRKIMTDDLLMANENIGHNAMDRDGYLEGTNAKWHDLWSGLLLEISGGTTLTADLVVVTGRKADGV